MSVLSRKKAKREYYKRDLKFPSYKTEVRIMTSQA